MAKKDFTETPEKDVKEAETPEIESSEKASEEPVIEKITPEEMSAPAPAPVIKRVRKELVSKVKVKPESATITVNVELDDIPTLAEVRVKTAQADAKIKSLLMKLSQTIGNRYSLSISPVSLDLARKKIVMGVSIEPALEAEKLEAVLKATG